MTFTPEELQEVGRRTIGSVLNDVWFSLMDDPDEALEEVIVGKRQKKALAIDLHAERLFRNTLHRYRNGKFKNITVLGEESLRDRNLDLTHKRGTFALVDAVDGTDLLERGLYNWCSAATFFDPQEQTGKKILAAFVGLPTGEIYFALGNKPHAYVTKWRSKEVKQVSGPSRQKNLEAASVCFYGQKVESLLTLFRTRMFEVLEGIQAEQKKSSGQPISFRIYNLGGIPMLVRLSDFKHKEARGIDAVIELKGQQPHDFVPGGFIAKKAGAIVKDLNGTDLHETELETMLLTPTRGECRYIVASTPELYQEIRSCVL